MNLKLAQYVDIKRFSDERGYFCETLNLTEPPFDKLNYIQNNVSVNKNDVLRGMHYQHMFPQGKFCYVLSGAAYDFVIDLRQSSPDFLKCRTFYLEPKGPAVWVPPGYAHGFLSCYDNTVFSYHVFGNPWVAGDEHSINPSSVPDIKQLVDNKIYLRVSPKDAAGYDFYNRSYPVYE